MKRIAVTLIVLVTLSSSASGQWKKIADFIGTDGTVSFGEYITCIYFLDLPDESGIGFAGTQSELHKTTDGGKSWHSVWDSGWSFSGYYVTGICFKDRLTGWFTIFGDTSVCYMTTDGGESWAALSVGVNEGGANAVYYCSATNRLFLAMAGYVETRVSTDLGTTWQTAIPSPNLKYLTTNFSFSSDLNGIAAAGFYPDTVGGYLITSDGGITWDSVHSLWDSVHAYPDGEPLAIPGTSICFEADYGWYRIIRRSDDYGRTWREIANLTGDSSQYCTGIIGGNLSRLYIQTDSGMYVSVDSGVTWKNDGGPPYNSPFTNDLFYSANGVTIAGMTYDKGAVQDGGLWEENWPQAGVAEQQEGIISCATASPNPVTTGTIITFGISQEAYVKINLFDILGHEVSSPGFECLFEPGNHEVPLSLQGLESGTYYARILTAYGSVATVKLVKEQ